jgi:TonB-linked SusC/RagA family outer membrane protein
LINSTTPVPADIAAQLASGVYPLTGSAQVYAGKTYSNIKQLLGMNPYNVADNAIVGIDGKLNPAAKFLYPADLGWEKGLSRVGKRGDYGVSFSGGGPKNDYFVSMGYVNEKGFVIKSDYERITGRININANPINWFKTGLNLSGTVTTSNVAADGSSTGFVNPFFFSRNIGPIYPIYMHNTNGDFLWDANGNKQYDLGNTRTIYPGRHVIAETNFNDNLFKRNAWTGKTFGEITITKDLKFTNTLSVEINNYDGSTLDNKIVGDGAPGGRASKTTTLSTTFNINQILNYNKSIGKHNFEAMAGHENYSYVYNYLYGFRTGQIADGNTELVNFTTTSSLTSYTDKYTKEGYFGQVSYNFDNKYYAKASYRHDGSSKFQEKVRWGNFGAVSAGWRLDQEPFMKNIKAVDGLKVRASYGTVGSDNELDLYAYQALYALAFNNAAEPCILQSSLGNLAIQWETNTNFDLGIDFSLFKRVTGTFDYYERQSKNLLFQVNLPLSSGVLIQNRNIGTMSNSGFEFQANTLILKNTEFKWNVDFNVSTVKNELKKLPFVEQINGTKKFMVGHSIYDYWLRESMGVDPANGNALYRAVSLITTSSQVIGKDTVTSDPNNARYHYAGTAIPDLYGSVTSHFTYKNFELTLAVSFQLGGKIYDANYAALMSSGSYGNAMSTDMLNRWQKPGDITNVPRLDAGKVAQYGAASDRWLTSGTYFNFKTINFGYNLPQNMVRKLQMQNVRVYLSGDNLWLKASRTGLNPTQAFSGVTSNAYVPARVVTVGLNVTL